MSKTVPEPDVDEIFGEAAEAVAGDWDREFWVGVARSMVGIDEAVLEERSTAWIVARCEDAGY